MIESSVTKTIEDGELKAFRAIKSRVTILPTDACLRVETVADFCDAARLLMAGHRVTVLPVAGCLRSFRRVTRYEVSTKKTASLRTLLSGDRRWQERWRIDARHEGLVQLLNHRAHRLLSVCDIADALEWILSSAPESARLDLCVPYGHPSWGHFVRRENDIPDVDAHRPPTSQNGTRTVLCYVEPTDVDRAAIAAHGALCVDASVFPTLLTNAIALSFDKTVALPNYGWRPRLQLDLSDLDQDGQFAACKLVARHALRLGKAPPAGLQQAWRDQHWFRHLQTFVIEGRTIDHDRHLSYWRKKLADCLELPQPDAQLPTAPVAI